MGGFPSRKSLAKEPWSKGLQITEYHQPEIGELLSFVPQYIGHL